MREIKFRAYDKTAKQMYRVDRLGIGKYSHQQYAEGDEQPKTGKNKFYPSQVEIMQYTGLKDKNGVEIYEGDIVRLEYQGEDEERPIKDGVINFRENQWCVNAKHLDGFTMRMYTREVIGNIYEE